MSKTPLRAGNEEAPASQADSDEHLVRLWVGRHLSPHTRRNYARQARQLLAFLDKRMAEARIGDLQAYMAGLEWQAPATRANTIAAIKSLYGFGQEVGHVRTNPTVGLKAPAIKNKLAERVVEEDAVLRMIAGEQNSRNRALLSVLYAGGLRVSEACGLSWADIMPRAANGAQLTVYGKRGKTRHVLVSAATWTAVAALRGDAAADAPVFRSRQGGALDVSAVLRVVKTAAKRSGLPDGFSPHWLRHACASHSLNAGAPISLVQKALGHAGLNTTALYLHARVDDGPSRFLKV